MTRQRLWRRIRQDYGPYLPLSPYLFVVLFPFYWMLITAFKRDSDLYNLTTAPFWFKEPPTLAHVKLLLEGTLFLTWLQNSLLIGVLVVLITLALALPAAYALARMRFWGSQTLSTGMFLSYLIPPTLLFLPLSQLVRGLGFTDSIWALVAVYPSFTLPFCTWLLMGFVRTVPREIEESAQIDGCTRLQAFRMIILPVIVPGIITAGIFAFTLTYQEYIYALTFVSASANKTISYGVTTDLVRGDVFYWGSLMSGALIGALPVAIVYAFSLDHFIHGLTAGALK
ncbi:MAG TPA: carbohydrate ABC transporter permease [Methylomirabilota bacterium]|nr:carbohydrate ABC transporter permease [Methylomirabilota bacterium]